jgi:hypothetical protein
MKFNRIAERVVVRSMQIIVGTVKSVFIEFQNDHNLVYWVSEQFNCNETYCFCWHIH